MLKIEYEVTDGEVRNLLVHAGNAVGNVQESQFAITVRLLVKYAFEAGRDFQRRYNEDEE